MTSDRRLGWLAILAGAGLALGVQIAAPVGVPLYDGVVVQEPYRYLHPVGDQVNDPTSFSSAPTVIGNESPRFAAATLESPPQAQLIAQVDAFELPPGATSLRVSITPIEPPSTPPGGTIAGNAYRFSVTDQAGNRAVVKPCQGCLSLTLRAPEGIDNAVLKQFADGAWTTVETLHSLAMYQTNPTALGDYAVVSTGAPGDDPVPVLGGTVLALLLIAGVFFYLRRRSARATPVERGRGSGPGRVPARIPSKRRPSRRPPSGRSDR